MISIPNNTKKTILFLIKILIVGGAFYFIYNQLANNDKLNWEQFIILFHKNQSISGIAFILLLSVANRFFEILKWKNLVSSSYSITLSEATEQVLAALTAGLFTPNGIGEYAGKAFYFQKKDVKNILFLNLICNGIQMVLTILLGILGFLYFNTVYQIIHSQNILILFGFFTLLIVLVFFSKNITIKGYSILTFIQKINELPKEIHQKNIAFGLMRYLVFSHQYYFLFLAFDVHLPYFILMAAIASVYFLASSLPTFQFLDFAVKGSVGVYFFGILGINEWIVVFISTLMWFLNVVLPVIIGSYYVLNFKLQSPTLSGDEGDKD